MRTLWALVLLLGVGWANADPPGRVARLAYVDAQVSFSPAGQDAWVQATPNRPLTSGDRLWSDAGARAEVQLGGAAIRLGPMTNVTLLNMDDSLTQLQLLQGTLKVRVRHLGDNQSIEVDTPNLAFTVRRAGDYRIDVDPNVNATTVSVNGGEAEVYGNGVAYAVRARQAYRFYGVGLTDYDTFASRGDDDLDHWAQDRDRRIDSSASARYVSSELVGYEDLDSNGTWRVDANYGNVWIPSHVAADWTPYREGRWAWVDPWGWTWMDDAPWGYAVSHYGRWARISNAWGWVPGPRREQAVYAPALVVFLGGPVFQASVSVGASTGTVGWFPLAPREVYQPAYRVSRGYFDHINRSNAVIAPTVISNIYNTYNTNVKNVTNVTNITRVVYGNQAVAGAVVAVPAHAFLQSQSVAKLAIAVPSAAAMSAPVVHFAAVAPVVQSVQGGAVGALSKPVAPAHNAVVARTPAPPAPIPFVAQVAQLAAKPGTPIEEPRKALLKPTAAVADATTKVNVLTLAKGMAPTALPPASPPAPKTSDQRKALANGDVRPNAVSVPVAAASKPAVANADTRQPEAAKESMARASAAAAAAALAQSRQRAEAARVESQKRLAENAEAARLAAAKTQATKDDTAKADAARAAEAARVAAAKKAETDRLTVAKIDATKAREQAERAQQSKARETKAEDSKVSHAHIPRPSDGAKAEDEEKERRRVEEVKKR